MGISWNLRFSRDVACANVSRAPSADGTPRRSCANASFAPGADGSPRRSCANASFAPGADGSPRRSCYPVLRNRFNALIIDGSEFQRIYHGTLLSAFGVDVWEVKNGYEALALVLRGIVFDVIFIDMDLAYLNGASTTRILRRLGVRCKIIGIAVYRNRESDQEAFMVSGLNGYHDQLLTYERLHEILRMIDDER